MQFCVLPNVYHTERHILGNGSMLDVARFCFAADDLCPWFEQCKVYLAGDVGENTYHLLHHHKLNKTLEVGAWPSCTDCRHQVLAIDVCTCHRGEEAPTFSNIRNQ